MNPQLATPRSIALVALLALASLSCLAIATRAADDKTGVPGSRQGKPLDVEKRGDLLFNGIDYTGWKFRDPERSKVWSIAEAMLDPDDPKKLIPARSTEKQEGGNMLRGAGHGTDIYTTRSFGDCQLHVEFMIPDGSNSGVYLMGQYEVQVLSNFGKPDSALGPGDCGGIYNTKAPTTNALKPYGQWNSYDITFRAPRFDTSGKKTENAKFIKVVFNGKLIHQNVQAPKPTGSELPGGEKPRGPVLLQGDHGICAFRNLRIEPLDLK
ncbi:MAG TPA: DUF1080 domain-containing protein [Tepidisphaeraceae bacterium]|nr:DUF1080 domain-containing protein [Tepidisphaeraceae bacterium]